MIALVNAANCSVAQGAAGTWLATKTGGNPSAADASAVSTAGMAGDFVLSFRALGTALFYAGVSSNPLADNGPASIERCVQINGTTGRVFESGTGRPGGFAIDGWVWVRRTGGTIEYLTGPDLASATLRRTSTGGAAPLFFDSALVTPGVALEVRLPSAGAGGRKRRPLLSLGFTL